jgi:hypothetical protein
MLVELKNKSIYEIRKINDSRSFRVLVSNGKLTIEFQKMAETKGWASVHTDFNDPLFPIDDMWDLVEQLDFFYTLHNREN